MRWPPGYRLTFARLREISEKLACKTLVELLSLAHDRTCEAELAGILSELLETDQLPDVAALQARFAPDPGRLPQVHVELMPLSLYETLARHAIGEAA